MSLRRRDILKAASALPLGISARQANAQRQRYEANWASIDSRPTPSWYTDAKFGIFIHWGVYSVPAFAAPHVKDENPYAEWYWNSLTNGMDTSAASGHGALTWAFHKHVYGARFPYFDFAPLFRAELFNPDEWADLFARSGARYVALTSKHHEGFTLWHSAEANRSWGRPWNSVDIGPRRDLLLDLTEAGRRKGLHMGIYYSLYEWYNPLWLTDKARYVTEHMIPQFKDVVTHAKPAIIFSDGEWEQTSEQWHAPELLAWLFNESPVAGEVVINDRWGKETRHKHGGYYTTEYTAGMQQSSHPWEENRGMGFSYGYNRNEKLSDYRTDRELLLMLVDIVSRGGNLLLDIGPRADGGIPVIMEERLTELGKWLGANGESIYATRPWRQSRQWSSGTVPRLQETDFRGEYDITKLVDRPAAGMAHIEAFFTAKGDAVYALLPRWPSNGITLNGVAASSETKITLLGSSAELRFEPRGANILIHPPEPLPSQTPSRNIYVLKILGVKNAA